MKTLSYGNLKCAFSSEKHFESNIYHRYIICGMQFSDSMIQMQYNDSVVAMEDV